MSTYDVDDVLQRFGAELDLVVKDLGDPAAGTELDLTVPAGEVWEVRSIVATLTTDATVINRHPVLTLDDGNVVFARIGVNTAIAASLLTQLNYVAGASGSYSASNIFTIGLGSPLPTLLPGWRIRTATVNIQAGDNYSRVVAMVRRYAARGLAAEVAYELRKQLAELDAIDRAQQAYS